ncbi:MAG: ABC transporter ATP-binding protein [Patescibacteria group bacterium]|nr:ABC transporter ATP-binding protein [Patescibacteria group bacterium]
MSQETILRLNKLTKQYRAVKAVDQVSFEIKAGEIVGLLGPNGAGKTTTINMILGILEPSAGRIEILGKDLKTQREAISRQTNFAAVYAHLPANLTVRQNLYIFGLLYGVKNLQQRINFLLADFSLQKFAKTKVGLLSSGEASRLNLAKAIINEPKLLLLDEPTASLDPSIAHLIRQIIKDYVKKSGAAVLWTSHNMAEITDVCGRVLFMSHGKVLLAGDPKTLPALQGKKDLEELFIAVAREPLTFER